LKAGAIDGVMTNLENQLTNLHNQRVRAGVKARFGDDSSPYEMVGGARVSERKTASRILEWSAGIRLHLRLRAPDPARRAKQRQRSCRLRDRGTEQVFV
jgi:hypothetical protein